MDRLSVDLLLLIRSGRLLVVEPFWLVGRLESRPGPQSQLEEWLVWRGTVSSLAGNRTIACIIKALII